MVDVNRLHQQTLAAQDQKLSRAITEVRNWLDAMYRVLTDIRQNLPALARASEQYLKPVTVHQDRQVKKGRKTSTVYEYEQSAGWRLHEWTYWGQGYADQHQFTGAHYLLYDGQLAASWDEPSSATQVVGVRILSDKAFFSFIGQGHEKKTEYALSLIRSLYEVAGLPPPPLSPKPDLWYVSQETQSSIWNAEIANFPVP